MCFSQVDALTPCRLPEVNDITTAGCGCDVCIKDAHRKVGGRQLVRTVPDRSGSLGKAGLNQQGF